MPTYEYECEQCHERVEAVQKFTDPTLSVCPLCGGELRKIFSAVGIVFKGSGFYKNDSRGSKPKTTTTPSPSSDTGAPSTPAPASTVTPSTSPSPSTPASSTTSSN
jgi:putative FmdB family regulatory protein